MALGEGSEVREDGKTILRGQRGCHENVGSPGAPNRGCMRLVRQELRVLRVACLVKAVVPVISASEATIVRSSIARSQSASGLAGEKRLRAEELSPRNAAIPVAGATPLDLEEPAKVRQRAYETHFGWLSKQTPWLHQYE